MKGKRTGHRRKYGTGALKLTCLPVQRLPNAIGLSGLLRLYNKQSNPALRPSKFDLGRFHIVSTMEMKTLFKKPHVPLFLGDVMKQWYPHTLIFEGSASPSLPLNPRKYYTTLLHGFPSPARSLDHCLILGTAILVASC